MGLFKLNKDVRSVITSLDVQPQAWVPTAYHGKLFRLNHPCGVEVWATNRAYGVGIKVDGRKVWGGVTFRSTFGLSRDHWALSAAIGRWLRACPLPPVSRSTAADRLRKSHPYPLSKQMEG